MNGRKTIVGVCMLCALLVSAVAAQSASAISGTTVFTCKKGGGGGGGTFSDSHCKSASGEGEYGHYQVTENTTTELAAHAVGELKFKVTLGGQAVTLTASGVSGTGTVRNLVDPSGEHYVEAETSGVYTGVTVNLAKCFVYADEGGVKGTKGTIITEPMRTTSTGQGDAVKFTPKSGGVISRFWILDTNKKTSAEGGECSIGSTLIISGSVKGNTEGATFVFTHANTTEQNTLKCGVSEAGSKAGFEGSIALEGRDPAIGGDTYKPLSVTTVTT